jgi:hypothetical protein
MESTKTLDELVQDVIEARRELITKRQGTWTYKRLAVQLREARIRVGEAVNWDIERMKELEDEAWNAAKEGGQ